MPLAARTGAERLFSAAREVAGEEMVIMAHLTIDDSGCLRDGTAPETFTPKLQESPADVIGLMDAMKKYDPAKNVQFKSYAQFRIRGAILDSLRELDCRGCIYFP